MVARRNSRRIMSEFVIKELSSVDRPAQGHARAVLMKRADDVEKTKTKAEGGKQFPASDYAYVPDPESPSTWKLRLTSTPGGDPDPGIVGAAVAALGPGYRGQKVQIPDAARSRVVARVRAAWRRANPDKDASAMPAGIKKDYYGDAGVNSAPSAVAQAVEAVDFDTVLAEQEAREAACEVGDELREKWCALQRSFATIAADETVSAQDKITSMQQSLQQYIDSLAEQSQTIADEMGKAIFKALEDRSADSDLAELLKFSTGEDDMFNAAVKKQLDELQQTVKSISDQLAGAGGDEAKQAVLAKQLGEVQKQLTDLTAKAQADEAERAELVAKAGMSDKEKAYADSLDKDAKSAFMGMSPEDRAKQMKKVADEDPVVYKAADGTEFRKSDGDKIILLAKRNDELAKRAAEETKKREDAEFAKRAAEEPYKHFAIEKAADASEQATMADVVCAISKMDEKPRAALEKMLAAGGKAIAAAFETIGHSSAEVAKSADAFEKRVREIQKRDSCTHTDAMRKARSEFPEEFKAYSSSPASN